ncbi:DUF4062 domain-containing protein [Pararhizobium sp. BT-229]|uniref:DUF4062 domain-containing protein n=1 Tax=Pararhizobium sp. BT-229 TaxID=2986923 RepID=UPI0021F7AEAE|nr:DUF4062 domain-containing protein [Pararhizobium sp. BT-229]MCV9960294.1 DUF4062 domain-containing protein [Pararhizobium sp. BT-229]
MAESDILSQAASREKLDVFISSRLQECRAERTAARSAIRGINHNPVLFEHIGARSMRPRTLYLSRLRDSQIMVAIYRLGYGYIDTQGGMTISGLEDEFQFAREHGIPTLLYVYNDATAAREERLTRMIDTATPDLVISFYSEPAELESRIRDDVTAEITRFFVRPEITRAVIDDSATDLLSRATSRQGALIERPTLIEELRKLSQEHPLLFLVGRPGVGKTTLAAQFSERYGATYARVTGLSPLDLFNACAEAVGRPGSQKVSSTLQGAMLAFSSAWADADDISLIVDECDFVDELLKAISLGGDTSATKRVIFTSRQAPACREVFEIPDLFPGGNSQASALGIPDPHLGAGQDIEDWLRSNGTVVGRETLYYLALSPIPLAADDLLALLGDPSLRIETLYEELASVDRLIDDAPAGFRLAQGDISERLRSSVVATPQRLRFYTNRLERLFEGKSDYRSAYKVVEVLGGDEPIHYAKAALRQNALVGDIRFGRAIVERLLKEAVDGERGDDALELMLMLIYPMELMGEAARASELLSRAEELSRHLDDEAQARVAEFALASRARRTLAASDVEGLLGAWNHYGEMGLTWDRARLGLELSALYISSKSFEQAVAVLRPTLLEFQETGDEHGIELAERNLAAALAGLPGNDTEVDDIVSRIAGRPDQAFDPRRQRAWHNNILSRRYRNAGRLNDAERVTLETIELSLELGEEQLAALTYINLGNVHRDKREVAKALAAYDLAAQMAQRCGRRDIEADGSRLRAGVLNDLPESSEVVSDRFYQAKLYAQHALGLLAGSIYHEAIARSHIELAEAEVELGNERAAAMSYFAAAAQFQLVPDAEGYDHSIVRAAEHALDYDEVFYIEKMFNAFGLTWKPGEAMGDQFLELVEPMLRQTPRDFSTRMVGRHLHHLRINLPPLLRPILIEAVCDAVESMSLDLINTNETWRLLYPGFLLPYLSQDKRGMDVFRRLAAAATRSVPGLDVRYAQNGDCIWTVVLETDQPMTISLLAMDDGSSTAAAIQCLAQFLKAFELEIGALVGKSDIVELSLQVATYDEMPEDIQRDAAERLGLADMLARQTCAVSRPSDFSGSTPTFVFLGSAFLEEATTGEGAGGSMQMLFGLTLIEIVHQCFRGEVNDNEIRPKIVSLVQQTIS